MILGAEIFRVERAGVEHHFQIILTIGRSHIHPT